MGKRIRKLILSAVIFCGFKEGNIVVSLSLRIKKGEVR